MKMHQDVDGTDEDEIDNHRAWRCTVAHIDLDVSDYAYWLGPNHIRLWSMIIWCDCLYTY